ncbi:hypothetical protein L9F63_004867, partial [Diploptera punctata]
LKTDIIYETLSNNFMCIIIIIMSEGQIKSRSITYERLVSTMNNIGLCIEIGILVLHAFALSNNLSVCSFLGKILIMWHKGMSMKQLQLFIVRLPPTLSLLSSSSKTDLAGGLIFCIFPVSSSRFLHFPTVDGCSATLNSRLAASRSLAYVIAHVAIVISCCIFNAILTNDLQLYLGQSCTATALGPDN